MKAIFLAAITMANADISSISRAAQSCRNDWRLVLDTDDHGNQTAWSLTGPAGLVAEGGHGYADDARFEFQETLCDGAYEFEITDSVGDGMCCYRIELNGEAIVEVGEFDGFAESSTFVVASRAEPTPGTLTEGEARWAVCGTSGVCEEQERLDVPEELHEVRCCSDSSLPGFVKKDNCNVWGQSLLGYVCYLDQSHDSAQSLCAAHSARLCTKEELEENCAAETGCEPANKLVWSSTISTTMTVVPSASPSVTSSTSPSVVPSTIPSTTSSASPSVVPSTHPSVSSSISPSVTSSASPSVTSSASPSVTSSASPSVTSSASPSASPSTTPSMATPVSAWAICSRKEGCNQSDKISIADELHAVRCCSGVALSGFEKKLECNVWGQSLLERVCYRDKSLSDAQLLCASRGARLCSKEELEEECAASGCFDNRLAWSSTDADLVPTAQPTSEASDGGGGFFTFTSKPSTAPSQRSCKVVEFEKHFVACGKKKGCETVIELPVHNRVEHGARCCSDSPKADWHKKSSCDVWAASRDEEGNCPVAMTHPEASCRCEDMGARLCTRKELLGNCAALTGCGLDKEIMWTSTPLDPRNTLAPTPTPDTTHYAACGKWMGCVEFPGVYLDNQKFAVSCCSDESRPPPYKQNNSQVPSHVPRCPYADSNVGGGVFRSHSAALKVCEEDGARLCTGLELLAQCVTDTGRGINKLLAWSSDELAPT